MKIARLQEGASGTIAKAALISPAVTNIKVPPAAEAVPALSSKMFMALDTDAGRTIVVPRVQIIMGRSIDSMFTPLKTEPSMIRPETAENVSPILICAAMRKCLANREAINPPAR